MRIGSGDGSVVGERTSPRPAGCRGRPKAGRGPTHDRRSGSPATKPRGAPAALGEVVAEPGRMLRSWSVSRSPHPGYSIACGRRDTPNETTSKGSGAGSSKPSRHNFSVDKTELPAMRNVYRWCRDVRGKREPSAGRAPSSLSAKHCKIGPYFTDGIIRIIFKKSFCFY